MKGDRHIGIYLKSVAMVCGLLFFACSQDEEIASNKVVKSDMVTFGLGISNEWKPDVIGGEGESRSRTLALPMDCENGSLPEGEIYMYLMVEDCPAELDTVSVDSRAGENGNSDFGIYAFQVSGAEAQTPPAYKPDADGGVTLFMDNVNFSNYTGDNLTYWPGGGSWLQFFAYQPYCGTVEGLSISATDFNPTFTYNVPTTVTDQSDLMVGAAGMFYGNHCQEVELNLSHILSKIQVKAGNIPCGEVKSISFENIYSSGTYPFVSAMWTHTDNKENYTQEGLSTKTGEIGQPFHLLPQTLSDDAMIKIVMEVTTPNPNPTGEDDKERTDTYTLTKKLKDFKTEWSKNKQYTYVITTPQQVEVEVTDKVEGKTKKDLVIKNTGMSPVYIRAAIIGNWVQFDDDSNIDVTHQNGEEKTEGKRIVADWKETDGEFDWGKEGGHTLITDQTPNLGVPDKSWIKCSDGFYYYTEIVQPGDELKEGNENALFNSYTLNDGVAPMANSMLELIIAVQAVYPDDVKLLWKEEIMNVLHNAKANDDNEIL